MRLALALLSLPLSFQILLHVFVFPEHLTEYSWPGHAQHHLLRSAVGGDGMAVCGLVLAFGPLRQGNRGAWAALAVIGVAFYGGFWLATASVDFGETGFTRYGTLGHNAVQTLLYAIGLLLAWRNIQSEDG